LTPTTALPTHETALPEPTIHFVSGLPRTGSTLLMNLLAQNPAHHVTPTSGLIHLLRAVMERWPQCKEFQAEGLSSVKPRVESGLRALMHGYFDKQMRERKTVFDKSRGWLFYIEQVEQILGRPIKVITLLRDVRAIVASWEKIYRRRGVEYQYPEQADLGAIVTAEERARFALRGDQGTGRSIARLRDAIQRCPDRLLLVPYETFTAQPAKALTAIHDFLGLTRFDYDPQHVQQVTQEDDNYLGRDLHGIRPAVTPQSDKPWKGILPEPLCEEIAAQYADLNALAAAGIQRGDAL